MAANRGFIWLENSDSTNITQPIRAQPLYYDDAYELTPGHKNVHHNDVKFLQDLNIVGQLQVDSIVSNSFNGEDGVLFPRGLYVDAPPEAGLYCSQFYERNLGENINLNTNVNVDGDVNATGGVITDDVYTNNVHSNGTDITLVDTVRLSTVANDPTASSALFRNSSNQVVWRSTAGLAEANFIDDFSSLVLTQSPDSNTSYIVCDKPWIVKVSHLSEADTLIDYGQGTSTSANPYNDMVGCVFFRWLTPSDLNPRYMALNNGFQVSPALGRVEASFRLNLRYLSHASISAQDMWFGLGRNMCTSSNFDLNGVVGFRYSSTEANWGIIYDGVGVAVTNTVYGSIPADEFTHTFRITIDTVVTTSTVNWYVDGALIGTQTISNLTRLGPRILHTYTKTASVLPGDGLGFVLDCVRVQQSYNRF